MRLRQVVLVARDLEVVVGDLCTRLGVEVCFRDPDVAFFGLRNALMPVGDRLIEVVSPLHDGTAAGRHLDRRGGDGGYMLMFEVDDLERERERVGALGVRVVWEGARDRIRGMHLHPADVGGAIVSLDQPDPPGSWGWAGTGWREHVRDGVVRDVDAVEMQAADPATLARRWADVLGLPAAPDAAGGILLGAGDARVRFVTATDGRGTGLGGVDLVASDRSRAGERMEIGGLRVRLV